jgi:PAS domain S-box-containing protein
MTAQRRDIRWNLIWTGISLMVLFWLTEAFVEAYSSSSNTFLDKLFHPDFGELLINLLVYGTLLGLIWRYWRQADVSDRLAASLEEALNNLSFEKARSEAILAASPDAVSVQDTDLRIIYQNEAHKEMMGDHAGEYCYAAYQHRPTACEGCHLVESFSDGLPHRREASSARGEETRHVEIYSAPVRDHAGRIVAGIESVRDISDSKRSEMRLRQQLAAFEASIDGIAILNPAGKYIYLNRAHAAGYGYPSQDDLIGKSWHVLYTEEERLRLEPLIYAGLETEGGWRGEATGLKKDGSLVPQEISLTVTDDGGIICVVRDNTDRRRSEQEIRQLNSDLRQKTLDLQATNQELEAFSYSLTHDLRTPLTGIYLASQTVVEIYGDKLDETGTSMLRAICQSCERMEELIESMLLLFRVTSTDLNWEDVDLSSLANEVIAGIRLHDPERSVEWSVEEGMTARSDPHLVRILLENLIGNAWKYSARKELARIEFGQTRIGGDTRFFVRDNGIGFDMGAAGQIFKPFQRLQNARGIPGTGIGLTTAHRIVDRHDGRIWAEGEVGVGATVYFCLAPPAA